MDQRFTCSQACLPETSATHLHRAYRAATMRFGLGEPCMELLTLDHFARHVDQTFSAVINDGEVPFVLVEARALNPSQLPPGAARVPFSLLFRNGSAFLFPQQIYQMRHDDIGEVGIFLVPVAREQAGFLYQAIFN